MVALSMEDGSFQKREFDIRATDRGKLFNALNTYAGEIEPHASVCKGVAGVDLLNDAHIGRKVWGEQLRFNGLIGLAPPLTAAK